MVVNGGSAGSPAASVAREYGILAVIGAINGTQRPMDGQHVRVDGNHEYVTALD